MRILPLPVILLVSLVTARGSLEESVKTLAAVELEGRGNEAASAAWKSVVRSGPESLDPLLRACGSGTVVADNWIRLAGDSIVDEALRDKKTIPLAELTAFVRDTSHRAPARRLAFDLLRKAEPKRADEIEPLLINDPVQELRRGAVQRVIDEARNASPNEAKGLYQRALDSVRDEDQTRLIADELKKLQVPVDLPRHFGFLMKWNVIGPFDNTERQGFDAVFPPEKEIRLGTEYPGKGQTVKWQPFASADDYGKIDLNKPLGMLKEVTGYAVTTFTSATERDAEIRLGCKDAWKVWLNGELLFGRDEYHRGQQMDQYKLKCHLKQGANTILVKCCQNEQKEEWTVEWEFQLRVCDSAGTAILSAANSPAR